MSEELKPTQKQISQRYGGAADYPQHPHYFRRLRGMLFAATVAASILGALGFSYWGKETAYSPGPISQQHAGFGGDCRVCHLGSDGVLDKLRGFSPAALMSGPGVPALAMRGASISRMDEACVQCHASAQLHLPQAASLGARAISSELTVVHATGCATCHREHAGHGRMALPSQQTCVSCHDKADELRNARRSLKLTSTPVAASGENRNLGDGVVRFLAPARPLGSLQPFASYAQGHPPLHTNSPRRATPRCSISITSAICAPTFLRSTSTGWNVPTAIGPALRAVFQPVQYEQHCATCHTLQFQLALSALRIPHGDPEKVRYFLASREISFEMAWRAQGVSAPAELKQHVQTEIQELSRRGLNNLSDLERRVFFEGDPPGAPRIGARNSKFVTECQKCHTVTPGNANHAPVVQPPKMAERWVQRGPFTHLPHRHMQCADCHAAALKSTKTSDILLPAQKLCADCHRPPATAPAESAATAFGDVHTLAAAQRKNGGIKWDCTSCHGFHAPPMRRPFSKPSPRHPNPPASPR